VPKVSVTIITLNEADHIAAAIDSASWADEIIVVDSGSTDDTVAIARSKGVRVETRAWSGYVDQKNFAHLLASNDWIFSLDADERITPALAGEIHALLATETGAQGLSRASCGLSPRTLGPDDGLLSDFQTRLYDRRSARWTGLYVHESVSVNGGPGQLANELQHYSFRDLRDQLDRINHYTTLAARQMYERGQRTGPLAIIAHPAGGIPAELSAPSRNPRRNRRSHDLADELVFRVPEIRQALGDTTQLPTPNDQLPTTNFQRPTTSNSQRPTLSMETRLRVGR
jgi:hypothetical protein